MSADQVGAALSSALSTVPADGLAVGVRVGRTTVFQSRGAVCGRPVTEQTVLYGASVTKQMIGLLLAQAVEEGIASDADRLADWFPELPAWARAVRLGHLIHHTSGLPDVAATGPGDPRDNAEVIRRLQRCQPVRPPGVSFAYNNAGYVVLAETLRRGHGLPVEQLADEQLFSPLAMTATRLGSPLAAHGDHSDPPGTIGDGGLWTSASDLLAWLTALNAGWFSAAAIARAESPGSLDDGSALDYAWGMRLAATPHGRRITHGGSWAGWLAKTVRLPESQIAVAVLSIGGVEDAVSSLGTDLANALALLARRPGFRWLPHQPTRSITADPTPGSPRGANHA